MLELFPKLPYKSGCNIIKNDTPSRFKDFIYTVNLRFKSLHISVAKMQEKL